MFQFIHGEMLFTISLCYMEIRLCWVTSVHCFTFLIAFKKSFCQYVLISSKQRSGFSGVVVHRRFRCGMEKGRSTRKLLLRSHRGSCFLSESLTCVTFVCSVASLPSFLGGHLPKATEPSVPFLCETRDQLLHFRVSPAPSAR